MNKHWIAILLFCSTGLYAAEKSDFKLKWHTEPNPETQQRKETDPSYLMNGDQSRQHSMFDRTDKANRQSCTDPMFSSFNSDGGCSGTPGLRIEID